MALHSASVKKIIQVEPGDLIAGRYRILSIIGKGGMGYVYAAEEESLGIKRLVALKVLPPQLMMDEGLRARFLSEIKIAAGLDHPNIVPIYTLGEHFGLYFYVMKLLDGETAVRILRNTGPFEEQELRRIISLIARALQYAHKKGVIHRDVKSNNIHIGSDGNVTLMDFGIARSSESSEITLPGQVIGTAEYMSPEQWIGEVDGRSDIYSLGVVLYELATGRLPFVSKNLFELMKMHQEMPPDNPRSLVSGISRELEHIIIKCLAKDRADRFETADDLAQALEADYQPILSGAATGDVSPLETDAALESKPITGRMERPPKDLSRGDKKAWELCAKADEAAAHGDLDQALLLLKKAQKSLPDDEQIKTKIQNYLDLRERIELILKRAAQALADARPQQAIIDYENALRFLPLPAVVSNLQSARAQAEKAKRMYMRVKLLAERGKIAKALKLLDEVAKLDKEAGNLAGRRAQLQSRAITVKKTTRRSKFWTYALQFSVLALVVALIVGVIIYSPTALLKAADHQYEKRDNAHWFESSFSALKLYTSLKKMGVREERIDQRIQEIKSAAKSNFIELGNKALNAKQLNEAVKWYREALAYDPADVKLRDIVEVLEAKLSVRKTMN